MSTISPEEFLWTAVALFGIAYAWHERREARADQRAQRESGLNGAMLQWADFQVMLAYSLIVAFSGFLIVGSIAMVRAQNPDSSIVRRVVLAGGLIACEAVLVNIVVRIKAVRQSVRDELQRLRHHDSYDGEKRRRTDT